jgi:hypothetical protein
MRNSVLVVVVMAFAVAGGAQDRHPLAEHVSLIQLISSPEKYDGKRVNVVGYLSFDGVDGDGLYLHKEDCDNGIGANGFLVDRTKEMLREREKLYDNYVLIVGVFRRERLPYYDYSPGRITNIERCELWSEPGHPIAEKLKALRGHQPENKP